MKNKLSILIIIATLSVSSCTTNKDSKSPALVGKWILNQVVVIQNKDTTIDNINEKEYYVDYKNDKTFSSHLGKYGNPQHNSGSWDLEKNLIKIRYDNDNSNYHNEYFIKDSILTVIRIIDQSKYIYRLTK